MNLFHSLFSSRRGASSLHNKESVWLNWSLKHRRLLAMRTANPALREDVFSGIYPKDRSDVMTTQGVVYKTGLLFLFMLLSAGWVWSKFHVAQDSSAAAPWMMLGAIGGFILAMVISFKQTWAPTLSPVYALCQGCFIGGVSATFETAYPGIVFQAASLTFGTLASLLLIYSTGMIQVSDNFRLGVFAATGGIALFYLVAMVLSFFGIALPIIQGSGLFSIGFSVVVVAVAALNLILDFDFIEKGVRRGLPHYMEWYAAFALMVTLVWLYIEILRLLAKMRNR